MNNTKKQSEKLKKSLKYNEIELKNISLNKLKKDLKEFSKLVFDNTKIIPIFVEANERELIKLNSKEDASLINNILN